MPPSRIVPKARPNERFSIPASRAPQSRNAAETNSHSNTPAQASDEDGKGQHGQVHGASR